MKDLINKILEHTNILLILAGLVMFIIGISDIYGVVNIQLGNSPLRITISIVGLVLLGVGLVLTVRERQSGKKDNVFVGRWVGKTQGFSRPLHIWQFSKKDSVLVIETWWDSAPGEKDHFTGKLSADGKQLILYKDGRECNRATILSLQSFIIPNWDPGSREENVGPFDVVFTKQEV
jgi:hypothetical protein